MPTNGHQDERFHENLRVMGQRLDAPSAPSPELIARCRTILETQSTPHWRQRLFMFRKPLAWSACGLAAAIALAANIWISDSFGSRAQAAMILSKLNAQMAAEPLLDITIEGIDMEDAIINGHIQVAPHAVAGDMRISAGDPGERVELDLSMAVSSASAWVLIRKLDIPDPQARALLSLFLIPGQETLVLLPEELREEGFEADFAEALEEFRSGELVKMAKVFEELTASSADTGATVVDQPDGTLLLTLPLADEQVIASVAEILSQFDHLEVGAEVGDEAESDDEEDADASSAPAGARVKIVKSKTVTVKEAVSGDNDAAKLVGATISVVYDPALEQVRSVSLTNLGRTNGRVMVELRNGVIDPAWLAAERVVTPKTRTVDLQALAALFGGMTGDSNRESHK